MSKPTVEWEGTVKEAMETLGNSLVGCHVEWRQSNDTWENNAPFRIGRLRHQVDGRKSTLVLIDDRGVGLCSDSDDNTTTTFIRIISVPA